MPNASILSKGAVGSVLSSVGSGMIDSRASKNPKFGNSAESGISQFLDEHNAVNALMSEEARIQREFEQSSAREAMKFEAEQAQINRDYQAMMSNTAYQRAVDDLRKAGLNPILAYSQGGASTTTGATASGYTSSGSSASGFKASGSKADVNADLTQKTLDTYLDFISSLVSSASRVITKSIPSVFVRGR